MPVRARPVLATIVGIAAAGGTLMLAAAPALADAGVLTFSNAQLQAAAPTGIPVTSFSFGVSQSANFGAGSGRGAAVGSRQLTVTIDVGKGSPVLFKLAAEGSHIAQMKLVAPGETLVFKDVAVVRVVESSGARVATQTITFAFTAMEDSNATPTPMQIDHMIAPPPMVRPPVLPTPTKSP